MPGLDSIISKIYRRTARDDYPSEEMFRAEIRSAARQLFERQPAEIGLPERAFEAFVVSLQEDFGMPLTAVKARLRQISAPGASP